MITMMKYGQGCRALHIKPLRLQMLGGSAILAGAFLLGGCGSHTSGPATALRSPNNFDSSNDRLYGGQTPHPLLVVSLPNHPGGPVTVDTVVSVLIPHPTPSSSTIHRPITPEQPTQMQVVEGTPSASTQPTTEATTRPTTAPATQHVKASMKQAIVPAR